jgi:hypothetical protein
MQGTFRAAAVGVMLLGAAAPAMAHHAFTAEFDVDKPITVSGTIAKLEWVNPHAWLWLDVKGEEGKVVSWAFEMGSPNMLLRRGWKIDDIKPGTVVQVSGFKVRSGLPVANASVVKLPDGRDLFARANDAPER